MRYQVFVGESSENLQYFGTRSCQETADLVAREYVRDRQRSGIPMQHIVTEVRPHPDDLAQHVHC